MSDSFDALAAGMPDERPSDNYVAWLEDIHKAIDEDRLWTLLAQQRPPRSLLARQQIRGRLVKALGGKLKELGSGASAARTADAWLQEGGEDGELVQGKEFVADEIEPWGQAVDGGEVLDEVHDLIDSYVYATEDSLVAITLWAAYSHAFGCFGVSPLLDLSSPTKRCGKSTVIVVLRLLCPAALLAANVTPAALFRAVEAWKPTLLIDEADSFATMHDELRGILNAGHTRDTAYVLRAEGESNEPRMFSTWAPKVVAAIGRLPDTIEDRAIRVPLTRKPIDVLKSDAFNPEGVRADCARPRRRLARFVLDALDVISSTQVERPAGLNDRAWNNWRPLLAIAAAAGDDWLTRGLRAARTLSDGDEVAADYGTLALQHVWQAIEPVGRMKTADVLAALVARDDSDAPWAKWWESSLAKGELKSPAARLAKLLRPFGVKPGQLWIEDRKERGYDADGFRTDSVAPYLREAGRAGENGRTETTSQAGSTFPTGSTDCSAGKGEPHPLLRDEGQPPAGAENGNAVHLDLETDGRNATSVTSEDSGDAGHARSASYGVMTIEQSAALGLFPLPGDGGYLEWLERRRGSLTKNEWRLRRLQHLNLFRLLAPRDSRGEDTFIEDVMRLFDARMIEEPVPERPLCAYPSHREAGDWRTRDGRLVCRLCHPPAPGAEFQEDRP